MEDKKIKCAWCCVAATADQLIQCRHLYEQQKCLKSKYETVIIVTNDIPEIELDYFDKNDIPYIIKPALQKIHPEYVRGNQMHVYYTVFNKLHAWSLSDYDLLCFLETDTIITENIDNIIDSLAPSFMESATHGLFFCREQSQHSATWGMIFLVKPDMETYHKMLDFYKINDFCLDDQLFASYFSTIENLQWEDFTVTHYTKFTHNKEVIIHFPGRYKPWLNKSDMWTFFTNTFNDEFLRLVKEHEEWIRFKSILNDLCYNTDVAFIDGTNTPFAFDKHIAEDIISRLTPYLETVGMTSAQENNKEENNKDDKRE